jgi:hypothetical protein
MTRWWKHVAVLAAWLALGVTAQAQPGYPSPVGATRIPEPIRYTPEPQPYLVPGGMTPEMAPVGPPSTLNLPTNHTSAFQLDNFPTEAAGFASIGAMGLQRQRLPRLPVAFVDNQSNGIATGVVPIGIQTLADGAFNVNQTNQSFLPTARRLSQLSPDLLAGGRLTAGYLFGNQAIEVTGFYNPDASSDKAVTNPGGLFVPFGPIGRIPAGFGGVTGNGLFLQADRVDTTFSNEVGSAEVNFRAWDSGINRMELILGLRYFYSKERIGIRTDESFLSPDIFGRRNPLNVATYAVGSRNNLVAPQFGGEYSVPLGTEKLSWIWFTGMGKAAVGPNFIQTTRSLTRGDGLTAFTDSHTTMRASGLGEVSGFVDFHLLDRLRLRAGYTALYGVNFSTASSQVQYDLTSQKQGAKDHGSVFWHGPIAELQFLF